MTDLSYGSRNDGTVSSGARKKVQAEPQESRGAALRRWFAGPAGRIAAIVFTLIALVGAVLAIKSFFGGSTPSDAHYTMYICSETGRTFRHKNELGETHPIKSPYSGKNTGVIAEACYWTADGQVKKEPTWVLLNELAGKSGPTFCPDCGRRVVGHNPMAKAGGHAPPKQGEYVARDVSRDGR